MEKYLQARGWISTDFGRHYYWLLGQFSVRLSSMIVRRSLVLAFILGFSLICLCPAEAKSRNRRKKRYYPPITHPVVLWARTLSQSTDREQRKIAAFKFSQYSLSIFQEEAIQTLIQCMRDTDEAIKILCAKAMRRAGLQKDTDRIRKALLTQFDNDPALRSTLVRTFIDRKDESAVTHDYLLNAAKQTKDLSELLAYLSYFEKFGSGTDNWVSVVTDIYRKNDDIKLKRAAVKALAERGHGQEAVVSLLSECVDSKDTPLVLNCLSGLELQAKNESQARGAVKKTLQSEDPDVLLATLDVILAQAESPDTDVTSRLIEIIEATEDLEIKEKTILALGVYGDKSHPIFNILKKILENRENEATSVAAALVLGKQSSQFPEQTRTLLQKCSTESHSPSLRTACKLGLQDFEKRALAQVGNSTSPDNIPEKKPPQ